MDQLQQLMPREGTEILLVLFLSFLVGLEREEHKGEGDYSFGGVRTFPLIGLIGYATAMLSGGEVAPVAVGFAVVAAFMLIAYRHKLGQSSLAGATSEMSALVTYLIGALVRGGHYWVATTLGVVSLLLLELKVVLESMARRSEPVEILTFAKFLLLSAVILPALPNQPLGPFGINPFSTWLVVVAVSGLSYASYVIQRLTRGRGGIVLGALLGGAYSSTVMTVVLARRAGGEQRPHLFAGAMLVASGMMFLRLIVLLALFNGELASMLAPAFLTLAGGASVGGVLLARAARPARQRPGPPVRRAQPARAEGRAAVRRALRGDARGDRPGGVEPRQRRRLRARGGDGRRRRRPFHHEHDAGGPARDPPACRGDRGARDGREQQPGQGDLRVPVRRPPDGNPRPGVAGGPRRRQPAADPAVPLAATGCGLGLKTA